MVHRVRLLNTIRKLYIFERIMSQSNYFIYFINYKRRT